MTTSRAVVWAAILVAVAARVLFDWTAPLLDQHAFRQTQTALTVYWYLQQGIDLLRPPLPLFGTAQPAIPFEFPLYQAIVAVMLDAVGARSLEALAAGCRLVAFAFHLLAAWPLHRLARRHFSTTVADGAVLLWVVLPYAVFWSTTAMIEPTAVALTLIHVDLTDRSARASGRRAGALMIAAAAAGSLAALVKVTTFAVFLPAAGLFYALGRRLWNVRNWGVRDIAALLVLAAAPTAAALAWTHWADLVKAQNLVGGLGLTSGELAAWNFGSLAQRLSYPAWRTVAATIGITMLTLPAALAFLIGAVRCLSDPTRAAWLLPVALGPVVFFNLYLVHDYYAYAALAPACVVAVYGAMTVATALGGPQWLGAVAAVGLALATWVDADLRWKPIAYLARGEAPVYLFQRVMPWAPLPPEARRVLEIARIIREGGYPPGPIVVTGNDWTADIALYAERPAFMIGKDPDHWVGGCSERNWREIRQARPVLFIKLRPSRNECLEAVPIHACAVADTARYWIGTCMAGS
ncbi:MAG: glycosyltransferase family 39 protein [Alphaproteobacteria bacterium]|nr:glycosyltransferase family 39 protein [Alphaproteobacteria bacterium]